MVLVYKRRKTLNPIIKNNYYYIQELGDKIFHIIFKVKSLIYLGTSIFFSDTLGQRKLKINSYI